MGILEAPPTTRRAPRWLMYSACHLEIAYEVLRVATAAIGPGPWRDHALIVGLLGLQRISLEEVTVVIHQQTVYFTDGHQPPPRERLTEQDKKDYAAEIKSKLLAPSSEKISSIRGFDHSAP